MDADWDRPANSVALRGQSRQPQASEFHVLHPDVRVGQEISLVVRGSQQLIRNGARLGHPGHAVS